MSMQKRKTFLAKLIARINRKEWWHVPPRDRSAYRKRGKFLASSFREAEFWGRPQDATERVAITRPLIGDEAEIEKALFGRCISHEDLTAKERWTLDAKMKRAALRKGYDSIALLTTRSLRQLTKHGRIPRSIELNVVDLRCLRNTRRNSS